LVWRSPAYLDCRRSLAWDDMPDDSYNSRIGSGNVQCVPLVAGCFGLNTRENAESEWDSIQPTVIAL
jgi:hypothetical protein